jgi:hypothetical protein
MGTLMENTPGDATDTVERLRNGGRRALATIFDSYRDRLRRVVELRIDPRLRARIDASDVLQEAFTTSPATWTPIWLTRSCHRCSGCGCTPAGG